MAAIARLDVYLPLITHTNWSPGIINLGVGSQEVRLIKEETASQIDEVSLLDIHVRFRKQD